MLQTIQTLTHICRFKAYPQDLPTSGRLLFYAIMAAFVLSVIRTSLLSEGSAPILISLVQIVLLAIGLKILLVLFLKRERWVQSASAVFGCTALLMLAATPLLMITETYRIDVGVTGLILVAMNIWNFSIIVFILREALEINLLRAFFITFAFEILSAIILQQMF